MGRLIRFAILCFVGSALVVLAYAYHLWFSRPLDFQRLVYPIRSLGSLQQLDCEGPEQLSDIMSFSVRDLTIPSGQVALIRDGELSRCVVTQDGRWFSGESVSHDTRFRFASLTKPVVAATAYRTFRESPLFEQDHLIKHLPDLESAPKDPRVNDIRLLHLLSHRSGLNEKTTGHGMFRHGNKSWCPENWGSLSTMTLDYQPGKQSSYANANYCLLALAVEHSSGRRWYQLADEYLDVSDYGIKMIPPEGYLADEVAYDFMNSNFYMEDYYRFNDLESGASALGLSGSATGLARWFHERVLSDQVVSKALLRWDPMNGCDVTTSTKCYMAGLAGYVSPAGNRYFIHTGKLYGASAALVISETRDVLVWVGNGNFPDEGAEMLIREAVTMMESL